MSLYGKIKNPLTGKNVSIYGKLGKNILANYLEMYQFGGSQADQHNVNQHTVMGPVTAAIERQRDNFGVAQQSYGRYNDCAEFELDMDERCKNCKKAKTVHSDDDCAEFELDMDEVCKNCKEAKTVHSDDALGGSEEEE